MQPHSCVVLMKGSGLEANTWLCCSGGLFIESGCDTQGEHTHVLKLQRTTLQYSWKNHLSLYKYICIFITILPSCVCFLFLSSSVFSFFVSLQFVVALCPYIIDK